MSELKLTTQAIRKILEANNLIARTTNKTVPGIVQGNVALTRVNSTDGVDVKVWLRKDGKINIIRIWDYTRHWKMIDKINDVLIKEGYKVEHEKHTPCSYISL